MLPASTSLLGSFLLQTMQPLGYCAFFWRHAAWDQPRNDFWIFDWAFITRTVPFLQILDQRETCKRLHAAISILFNLRNTTKYQLITVITSFNKVSPFYFFFLFFISALFLVWNLQRKTQSFLQFQFWFFNFFSFHVSVSE